MLQRIWDFISCYKCWTGKHASRPLEETLRPYSMTRWN